MKIIQLKKTYKIKGGREPRPLRAKRAAIARTIVKAPEIVFADESTGALLYYQIFN